MLSITAFLLIDSFFVAPARFITRHVTIDNEQIPEQLDNMNILFFSDLKYGIYMNEERLNKLVDTINASGADVVLFGGDIYGDSVTVDDHSTSLITKAFSNIQAKYGKFAVYGDIDGASDVMKSTVNAIYDASDFEVIQNTSFQIHKNGSQFITVVGLDNGIDGTKDIDGAYSNVSKDSYVMTLCHTPDTVNEVPKDLTDYFLAGHSLGGQAIFIFTSFYEPTYATQYLRGKHLIDNTFTLDITNGTGTVNQDVRLFTPAEVVVYTLKMTQKKEETLPSSKLDTTTPAPTEDTPSKEETTPEETPQEENHEE